MNMSVKKELGLVGACLSALLGLSILLLVLAMTGCTTGQGQPEQCSNAQKVWDAYQVRLLVGPPPTDDEARFTPPPGASNVVITAEEAGVIAKGWRYVGGVFLKPDGSPIANGDKTRIDRAILIRDTISDFRTALANWDTLTAAQQKAVLKRCVQVLVAMLKERPELIAIKEEQ